jgi:hypothetical protein
MSAEVSAWRSSYCCRARHGSIQSSGRSGSKATPTHLRPVESCVSKSPSRIWRINGQINFGESIPGLPALIDRNPDDGLHHVGIGKANGRGRKAVVGLRPSFSAHVRWCERRAPVQICEDREGLEGKTCGIPHLAKKRARCPEFPVLSSGQDRVCGSL